MSLALVALMLVNGMSLPPEAGPAPVAFEAFPDSLHAFVWFNWPLAPVERMAEAVEATPEEIQALGHSMGLPDPPAISEDQWRRSYITIIRRNWHLLPYAQLLALLDWTEEELAYTLREDDFLYIKLGSLKPKCPPMRYAPPTEAAQQRAAAIAAQVREWFPEGLPEASDPLFGFIPRLSALPKQAAQETGVNRLFSPRYCSSYFMLYGDPFLDTKADAYPEGYLAQLAASGVDGVWLQAVLYKMAPFPWDPEKSRHYERRLKNLAALVARAKRHGVGVYLYLNEPRAMPNEFFAEHADLKGVTEGGFSAMCSSAPEVREYIRESVASICRATPDLAGFFTISASENLTNCWSHHHGENCPRCKERNPAEVIAEINATIQSGIDAAGTGAKLIAWDWGWRDDWAPGIIERLPKAVDLMSVSEWSIPVERGGVKTSVGEYSISVIGPGPRATRHWGLARERGLRTLAKIQANNTWELSAVPYIPAVANVAQHAFGLREAGIDGLMLGWTLGGHPSPNLEVVEAMGRAGACSVESVLEEVAARRYGPAGPAMVDAWKGFSRAFSEFPYNGGLLYHAPMQMGPANPIWPKKTGYHATMVCFPYDALDDWRGPFPRAIFIQQFERMADGFDTTLQTLAEATDGVDLTPEQQQELVEARDVASVCAIHFRSCANQARFVDLRDALNEGEAKEAAGLKTTLESELALARRLFELQQRNACFGFEASNHYFYVPIDLVAKMLTCQYLLETWLPAATAAQ